MDTLFQHFKSVPAPVGGKTIDVAPCTMTVVHGHGKLRTVVGCGVSVCLYDARKKIGGMNHFLFPRTADPCKATGRYGNVALIGLLEMMRQQGASFPLDAHVSGGAYCDEYELEAALENIRIAWRYLLIKDITIVSQHVGGRSLREIVFDTGTGRCTARQFRDV